MFGAPSLGRGALTTWFNAPSVLLTALVFITLYQWLQFPALPSNDDALFLSRGIGHFSVIEFSPHFPGYAGLVIFVKSLRGLFASDYQALHCVVLALTSMIPVVVYFILNALQAGRLISLSVAAILYSQPLLISVVVVSLTNGPGLLVWLLALLFLLKYQPVLAGFFSGVMLTVRPSYLLLLLPLVGYLLQRNRQQIKLIVIAIGLPLLLSFMYMYSKDGLALFEEAYRFISGHFLVWGNTSLNETSRASWWVALSDYVGGEWRLVVLSGLLLLSCFVIWVKHKSAHALIVSFASILLWTLLFQNPDNLRHLLPVLVLAVMILSLMLTPFEALFGRLSMGLAIAMVAYSLIQTQQLKLSPPAIQQALAWISDQTSAGRYENVIVTNEGVELARAYQTKRRVADAWYQQQAAWLWAGGAWRMTYNPIIQYGEPVAVFPRRLAGEHAMYVYRLTSGHDKQH